MDLRLKDALVAADEAPTSPTRESRLTGADIEEAMRIGMERVKYLRERVWPKMRLSPLQWGMRLR